MQKKLIVIYEPEQVESIISYIQKIQEPYHIIALNFWAERLLSARDITFEPLEKYALSEEEKDRLFGVATTFAREWYRLPELSFFEYKGVPIGESAEPEIDSYIEKALYFLYIFKKILEKNPDEELVVPYAEGRTASNKASLAWFEARVSIAVAQFLGNLFGHAVLPIGVKFERKEIPSVNQYISWRHIALKTLNWFVAHAVRPRPIKIFASEYWRNIAPVLEKMDDAELVLMDRSEIKNIPWRYIFSRRIRFIHPTDVLTPKIRTFAAAVTHDFSLKWSSAVPALENLVKKISPDINWWPLVEEGIKSCLGVYAQGVVESAQCIEHLLLLEKSNRVLLRGSFAGRQPHFFVAACISRTLGTPSIEIQHAAEVLDPRSVVSRFATSYIAGYGELTKKGFIRNHTYAPERIRIVGSHRFDHLVSTPPLSKDERDKKIQDLGLDPTRPIVLSAVQAENYMLVFCPWSFNSYDMASYLQSMATLKKTLPDIQLILKFRWPEHWLTRFPQYYKDYINELFPKGDVVLIHAEIPMVDVIRICDIAMSGNSTVLLEVMVAKKSLVFFPWKENDTYTLESFEGLGKPIYLKQHEELINEMKSLLASASLRAERVRIQDNFLAKNYSFDGHATERMVALLRENLRPL